MALHRIPIVATLDPEEQGAGNVIIGAGQSTTNLLYSKYQDQRQFAVTRPPLKGYAESPWPDVGGRVAASPRGVYFWEAANSLIAVDFAQVYKGAYGAEIGRITGGKDPVFFAEMSDTKLVLTDPENNEVWELTNSSGALTIAEITGTVQVSLISEGIAGGVVSLDGYCFIMSKQGKIYNSNVDDLTTWGALDFVTTLRVVDAGVYLTKQQENVVAFGTSSIEFFYNAAAPTGSPLKRRDDVVYNVGCSGYKTIHNNGNRIFFVGSTSLGSLGMYKLHDLQLQYVSYDTLDSWINDTLLTDGFDLLVCGGNVGEHYIVYVTSVASDINYLLPIWKPIFTAVYDDANQLWGRFTTGLYEDQINPEDVNVVFPVISVAERYGTNIQGQTLQLLDGKLAVFGTTDESVDSMSGGPYVTEDGDEESAQEYVLLQSGYMTTGVGEKAANIKLQIITSQWDADTYTNKFMHRFAVVGRTRPLRKDADTPITISWTDDDYNTYKGGRPLSVLMDRKLTRLGKFKRRAFKLDYEGTNRLRIEALEVDVGTSGYA